MRPQAACGFGLEKSLFEFKPDRGSALTSTSTSEFAILPLPLLLYYTELELIQTHMTKEPMLRAEVYARALRASQNRKEYSV